VVTRLAENTNDCAAPNSATVASLLLSSVHCPAMLTMIVDYRASNNGWGIRWMKGNA
jgi:hypothetical protein